MDQQEKIFIGTSGWSYPEWQGIVYPEGFGRSKMFEYYSKFFHTAEINSTFYQIPNSRTVQAWANKAPKNFKYSAKIPELVTHKGMLELDTIVSDLDIFMNNMQPLISSGKILAFLLQLPPKFGNKKEHDYDKLVDFIEYWRDVIDLSMQQLNDEIPELVVEFRNKYWMSQQVFDVLAGKKITYCSVIEPLLPPRMDITNANLFYIRFHGYGKKPWFNYNFSQKELDNWITELNPIVDGREHKKMKSKKVVIYFNNHFSGYAVKNALYLAKQMNLPHKGSIDQLTKPLSYLKSKQGEISQKTIDEFF